MLLQAGHPTKSLGGKDAQGTPQQSSSDGRRPMEVELLCLNESLSDSGSPPNIYFNSLFMPDTEEGQDVEAAVEEKTLPSPSS